QHVDGARIDVADVDLAVLAHGDAAARREGPAFQEASFGIEDGHALIVAVVDQQAALPVDGDTMRHLELAWTTALLAADHLQELTIGGEAHDARVHVTV